MLESEKHMSSHNPNTFTFTLSPDMCYVGSRIYVNDNPIPLTVVAYNPAINSVMISPSMPGAPEAFPASFMHPWLNDLTAMSKMLAGELKLPHLLNIGGNAKDRRRNRRLLWWLRTSGSYDKNMHCEECLDAFAMQQRYKSHSSERNV